MSVFVYVLWSSKLRKRYVGAGADLYGCSGETEVVYQKGEVTCFEYEDCEDDATLRHCIVEGGGHNWPGAVDLCEPHLFPALLPGVGLLFISPPNRLV